jgi:hypothetical protein
VVLLGIACSVSTPQMTLGFIYYPSTLLHATVYVYLHNLLNVLVQIANKMGLKNSFLYISVWDLVC